MGHVLLFRDHHLTIWWWRNAAQVNLHCCRLVFCSSGWLIDPGRRTASVAHFWLLSGPVLSPHAASLLKDNACFTVFSTGNSLMEFFCWAFQTVAEIVRESHQTKCSLEQTSNEIILSTYKFEALNMSDGNCLSNFLCTYSCSAKTVNVQVSSKVTWFATLVLHFSGLTPANNKNK